MKRFLILLFCIFLVGGADAQAGTDWPAIDGKKRRKTFFKNVRPAIFPTWKIKRSPTKLRFKVIFHTAFDLPEPENDDWNKLIGYSWD